MLRKIRIMCILLGVRLRILAMERIHKFSQQSSRLTDRKGSECYQLRFLRLRRAKLRRLHCRLFGAIAGFCQADS